MLLDVSIAPSYIKFGHNGGIQHPLLKIIKKFFFSKDTRVATLTKTVTTKDAKILLAGINKKHKNAFSPVVVRQCLDDKERNTAQKRTSRGA